MPPIPADDIELVLSRTAELWEQMRGEQILITGGTGFFGCWLVESFLAANQRFRLKAKISVLSRSPEAFRAKAPHSAMDPALTLLRGDIRTFEFPAGNFPFVIHAATEASAKLVADQPLLMLSTAIDGTRRALEFAASHGTQKFLLTSSGAVYGSQPAAITHVAEDYLGAPDPLDPASVYAEGKRAAELLCAVYGTRGGMECKIARCFAFVGPHLPLDAHFAIGNFIRDAMRGGNLLIEGDGTPRRSYMYAADLAIWLWSLLFCGPAQQAFNVGSHQSISILELARTVTRALQLPASIEVRQAAAPGARLLQYVPCIEKAARQLGLRCEVSLEDAIQRTAAWHRLGC